MFLINLILIIIYLFIINDVMYNIFTLIIILSSLFIILYLIEKNFLNITYIKRKLFISEGIFNSFNKEGIYYLEINKFLKKIKNNKKISNFFKNHWKEDKIFFIKTKNILLISAGSTIYSKFNAISPDKYTINYIIDENNVVYNISIKKYYELISYILLNELIFFFLFFKNLFLDYYNVLLLMNVIILIYIFLKKYLGINNNRKEFLKEFIEILNKEEINFNYLNKTKLKLSGRIFKIKI